MKLNRIRGQISICLESKIKRLREDVNELKKQKNIIDENKEIEINNLRCNNKLLEKNSRFIRLNERKIEVLSKKLEMISERMSKFVFETFKSVECISPKVYGAEPGFIIKNNKMNYYLKFEEGISDRLDITDDDLKIFGKATDNKILEASYFSIYGKDIAVQPKIYAFSHDSLFYLLNDYFSTVENLSFPFTLTESVSNSCLVFSEYYTLHKEDKHFIFPENLVKIMLYSILLNASDIRTANIVIDCTKVEKPRAVLVDMLPQTVLSKNHSTSALYKISHFLNMPKEYFQYFKVDGESIDVVKELLSTNKNNFFYNLKNIFWLVQSFSKGENSYKLDFKSYYKEIIEIFSKMDETRHEDTLERNLVKMINSVVENALKDLSEISIDKKDILFFKHKKQCLINLLDNALILDFIGLYNFNRQILNVKNYEEARKKCCNFTFDVEMVEEIRDNRELKRVCEEKIGEMSSKYLEKRSQIKNHYEIENTKKSKIFHRIQ